MNSWDGALFISPLWQIKLLVVPPKFPAKAGHFLTVSPVSSGGSADGETASGPLLFSFRHYYILFSSSQPKLTGTITQEDAMDQRRFVELHGADAWNEYVIPIKFGNVPPYLQQSAAAIAHYDIIRKTLEAEKFPEESLIAYRKKRDFQQIAQLESKLGMALSNVFLNVRNRGVSAGG
jgi:hypothetical protein